MEEKTSKDPALSGRRILIVEDELLLAIDLQLILENEGCEVLGPVPDEERALKLIVAERPDAVTLDLNLNGKSSLRIAEALVDLHVPFVIISGYSNRTESERALRRVPHLTKPVRASVLLETLRTVLHPDAVTVSAIDKPSQS